MLALDFACGCFRNGQGSTSLLPVSIQISKRGRSNRQICRKGNRLILCDLCGIRRPGGLDTMQTTQLGVSFDHQRTFLWLVLRGSLLQEGVKEIHPSEAAPSRGAPPMGARTDQVLRYGGNCYRIRRSRQDCNYDRRRLRAPAAPMRPVPSSMRVEGSGTAEVLSAVAWKVTIPLVLVVKKRENWVGS